MGDDGYIVSARLIQKEKIAMADNYFHLQAFVGEGLSGNPAGVYLLEHPLPAEEMQRIAAELNLPETAFVLPQGEDFAIRWFTPRREVDLCGHGTLAAAWVLYLRGKEQQGKAPRAGILFHSASGELSVHRDPQHPERLVLDFPARPAREIPCPPTLPRLLGCEAGFKPESVWQAKAFMVVLPSEQQVRALQPDIHALIAQTGRAVIVTAPGEQVDFISRYFTLDGGEDPVTGSAHCTLMPYWAARLGRNTLHARQLSARGGELFCTLTDERVLIGGKLKLFINGTIN